MKRAAMKRAACLFEKIIEYENWRLAYLGAVRGKRDSAAALLFNQNFEKNLETLRLSFASGVKKWGPYRTFTITDPKERVISAAPLEDRIAHHAIMNIVEPVFERQMVYHTYACRKNRGTHAAVRYAFSKCKGFPYFLKLDVRKYFDSIDHAALRNMLARIINDKKTLTVFQAIIESYATSPGCGVPIGNLTSQFFANLYLSGLDHFILETVRPRAYARYMDDFVLWGGGKDELNAADREIRSFAEQNLRLRLKPAVIGSTAGGLPFLGFLIKSDGIFLMWKSKRRMIKNIRAVKKAAAGGVLSLEKAAEKIQSIYAAVLLARTRLFRVKLWYGHGCKEPVRTA